MIEIIALIFLTRNISFIAQEKGLTPLTWRVYVILAWVATELAVAVIGTIMGLELLPLLLVAYLLAYVSFVLIKKRLQSKPDKDEWLNELGK